MEKNFILTDVMKTGNHQDLEDFIECNSMSDQSFDLTGEYYTLHQYDLDHYDRRFAIIDVRQHENMRLKGNADFETELRKRCDLLHSQGFKFIKATPWESEDNIKKNPDSMYPEIDVPHIKWTGGVSWFWFYMYRKHVGKQYIFDHKDKKYDFLYLNKTTRKHRMDLYTRLTKTKILDNSLTTFYDLGKYQLPEEYELPGVVRYPLRGLDQDIFEKPYNHTKFSLVSETNDTDDEVFMTEKIWKPIMAQHVFVVHGNYLYLQKLREMGFKTFSNYIDESYDLEKDPNKRIDKIVKLCGELTQAQWKDIYLQTQSLRQHNKDTLFNKERLSLEINKTIELFFEFADRS